MAEDLTFDQISWNGGTIEHHQGLLTARTQLMQGFGTHLLAGATLPGDEDGGLAGRRTLYDAIDPLHGERTTEKAPELVAVVVVPVGLHQGAQLLVTHPVVNRGAQALAIKGLGQEVKGAQTHGLHRHIH